MAPLKLSGRLAVILLVALLALWLGGLASLYAVLGPASRASNGLPERIAALVSLAESLPAGDRQRLLKAFQDDTLSVHLAPAGTAPSLVSDARLAAPLRARLPGREVQATQADALGPLGRSDTILTVRLTDDSTLVVRHRNPSLTRLGLPVGLGAGLLASLVSLAALVALHRELRPLSRLAREVDRIDPDGEPPSLGGVRARSPELRALVLAFERLHARLALLIRSRLALVGGIQHDLRTYATRLRLRVEQIPDPLEREGAVRDLADMIKLLDDALLASRSGACQLDLEMVDLGALVAEALAARQRAGEAVETGALAREAWVLGEPLALRRIVANLVENAQAYGLRARVSVEAQPQWVRLVVEDDGPGIPEDQRRLILEPFVRLEPSRARRTGGAGLGLAIVRSLAEAHGGTVDIGEAQRGGARLEVTLPRFHPS